MAWGYKVHEWQCETTVNKAEAIAHFIERRLRENYDAEQEMEKSKGKGNKSSDLASLLKAI